MLGTGWTAIALGIVIVAMRFFFRMGLPNGIAWDDYFVLFALVNTLFFRSHENLV